MAQSPSSSSVSELNSLTLNVPKRRYSVPSPVVELSAKNLRLDPPDVAIANSVPCWAMSGDGPALFKMTGVISENSSIGQYGTAQSADELWRSYMGIKLSHVPPDEIAKMENLCAAINDLVSEHLRLGNDELIRLPLAWEKIEYRGISY